MAVPFIQSVENKIRSSENTTGTMADDGIHLTMTDAAAKRLDFEFSCLPTASRTYYTTRIAIEKKTVLLLKNAIESSRYDDFIWKIRIANLPRIVYLWVRQPELAIDAILFIISGLFLTADDERDDGLRTLRTRDVT